MWFYIIVAIFIIFIFLVPKKSGSYFQSCDGEKCTLNPREESINLNLCKNVADVIERDVCDIPEYKWGIGGKIQVGDKKIFKSCCSEKPNVAIEKDKDGNYIIRTTTCSSNDKMCSNDASLIKMGIKPCPGSQPIPQQGECPPGMLAFNMSEPQSQSLTNCCKSEDLSWNGVGFSCSNTATGDLRTCSLIKNDKMDMCPPQSGREDMNKACPENEQYAFGHDGNSCCSIRPVNWISTKSIEFKYNSKNSPSITGLTPGTRVIATSDDKIIVTMPFEFKSIVSVSAFDSNNVQKAVEWSVIDSNLTIKNQFKGGLTYQFVITTQ